MIRERLIVYETDNGNYAVRPEQWAGIIDKNGRIKECGLNHTAIFHYKKDAEWYADAKNAEEQGLLLRLPYNLETCGVIYYVDEKDSEIYRLTADKIEISKMMISRKFILTIDSFDFFLEDFGKTVFLTRTEAEQALKKMKEV